MPLNLVPYTFTTTASTTFFLLFTFTNILHTSVGGPEFLQLDLFDILHLHNSTYQGITLGMGIHALSPGVIFTGEMRETMVSGDWVEKVRGRLTEIGANEFTISAIIKQNPNNVGTLLAFSKGLFSALEIQSSGRKNELRVISGSVVETFPFRLADGSWHRLAISFSASQVDILVDCNPLYRRVLRFDPATAIFDARNISLWIGQRTTSHFLYQGVMQDLRLTFGPHGYLSQCPQMDTTCPTCSDYTALKLSFASLQSQFKILSERLTRAEARLDNVETCECIKSCRVNATTVVNDGAKWNQNCENCTCRQGVIECHPVECPIDPCSNPNQRPGECCPKCRKCYRNQVWYDEGEVTFRDCAGQAYYSRKCRCEDGSLKCNPMEPITSCPPLNCPVSEQISIPGECCKICPGTDYCASHGHQCHANATCVNLQTTFMCHCNNGYSGDGRISCEDVNECLPDKRNHCNSRSTVCVNTPGSYMCECIGGFKRLDQYNCEDENECRPGGSNQCHPNAICENLRGSYNCHCKEGYVGNGFKCSPICNKTCENGGICIAPNVCSCRAGWTGEFCEMDIDECSEALNGTSLDVGNTNTFSCPTHALCVNKPGWYHCQCSDGFQATLTQGETAQCQDIDECLEDGICGDGMQCFNTIGSYECHCLESNQDCSIGCFEGGKSYTIGSIWFSQDCSVCTCNSPGTTCHPSSEETCTNLCSIESSNNVQNPPQCCEACGVGNLNSTKHHHHLKKSCPHQLYPDITYKSGETWHFQCQTCECVNGEIDCWKLDCPPLNCANPILPPGDCCYRCPEDKCTHWHRNSSYLDQCNLLETKIESGTQITLPHNHCISCKCNDGELCCTYDYDCVARESTNSDEAFLTSREL